MRAVARNDGMYTLVYLISRLGIGLIGFLFTLVSLETVNLYTVVNCFNVYLTPQVNAAQ